MIWVRPPVRRYLYQPLPSRQAPLRVQPEPTVLTLRNYQECPRQSLPSTNLLVSPKLDRRNGAPRLAGGRAIGSVDALSRPHTRRVSGPDQRALHDTDLVALYREIVGTVRGDPELALDAFRAEARAP
jgi:hypothetical protein